MHTLPIICQILCGLDILLAVSLPVLRYTKGPSNDVVTGGGILLFIGALVAAGAAMRLLHTGHTVASVVVAFLPLVIALAVVGYVYFILKNMRLF